MPWPYLREAQAAGVALYVSWSIVYNTLKGNLKIAFRFAMFEMFISVCYYWLRLMFETGSFEWNWYIIPAFAFALMLPLSLKEGASYIKDEEVIPEPKDHFNFEFINGVKQNQPEAKTVSFAIPEEYSNPVAPIVDPEFIKELEMKIEEFKALEGEHGQMKSERDAAIALSNTRAEELAKAQAEIEKLKNKLPDKFEVNVIEAIDEADEWGK